MRANSAICGLPLLVLVFDVAYIFHSLLLGTRDLFGFASHSDIILPVLDTFRNDPVTPFILENPTFFTSRTVVVERQAIGTKRKAAVAALRLFRCPAFAASDNPAAVDARTLCIR